MVKYFRDKLIITSSDQLRKNCLYLLCEGNSRSILQINDISSTVHKNSQHKVSGNTEDKVMP